MPGSASAPVIDLWRGRWSRSQSSRRAAPRRRTSRCTTSCWHCWTGIASTPPPSCLGPGRRPFAGALQTSGISALSPARAVGATGRRPAGQGITVAGGPGVDALGQPGEPGSHEQRADGTPWAMTGCQGRGDCGVAAGHLTIWANPLHCLSAPIRGKTEPGQVKSLPRRNQGGPSADHPVREEPGTGRAERAVSVEDKHWQAGRRVHPVARRLTRVARRPPGAGGHPRAAWAEPWSAR